MTIAEKQMKITFRTADLSDVQELAEAGKKAFKKAFFDLNTPEAMHQYMKEAFSPSKIRSEIQSPDNTFLLAINDGNLAGYAKLSRCKPPPCIGTKKAVEIARMYSIPEYIGKGVGTALVKQCRQLAEQEGFQVIWLASWKKNERANRFYHKLGFRIKGEQAFQLGNEIQQDHIFSLAL